MNILDNQESLLCNYEVYAILNEDKGQKFTQKNIETIHFEVIHVIPFINSDT